MSPRERLEAGWFHALAAVGTAAWWTWLAQDEAARPHFFGLRMAHEAPFFFLAADLFALVAGGAWLAWAILRQRREAPALAWVHFGAVGYAFLLTATLALDDGAAYFGFVAMGSMAAGCFLGALRLAGASILWGPFRPKRGVERDERSCRRATFRQTATMWFVFLGIVPAVLALGEHSLGWSEHWIRTPMRFAPAAVLFVAGGTLATLAARTMVRVGRGTPLPATSARELVCTGPYCWIRNPMALGSLTQGVAVALAIGSPLVLAYAFAGALAWELLVRHEEERFLERTFGPAYSAYRETVPCWFPRPSAARER
jgi:protein-S-isoprenylcysteine O-methyltransferase Ste14